jgi:hypothetical protein
MNPNKLFFKSFGKVISISTSNSEPFVLFFGAEGCRSFIMNDIEIIPGDNSQVTINIDLNGLEQPINLEISEPIKIFQRESTPYPEFLLNVGKFQYKKKQIFEGIVTIQGNCVIKQKPYIFYDG